MKKYAIFILLFAVTAFALPQSTGFVNDYANILPDRAQFEEGLLLYEQNTTIEDAVVTLDNGPDGNRMRIELGWRIQGYITGSEAGTILDKAMPYYTQGDYQTALDIILLGLSDELVDYVPGKVVSRDQTVDIILSLVLGNFPLFVFLVIIIIPIAMSNRCPYCRGKIKCEGDYCTCLKCKKKFKRKKRYAPLIIGGFGGGGGGFGGGGFGGGGSGGGGAGR